MKAKYFEIFSFLLLLAGCKQNVLRAQTINKTTTSESVSIVSWNLQTFFDANKDGTEYSEFLQSSNWTEQAYKARIKRLCEALKLIDADVYVFQEIENEGVLYDISNVLNVMDWNRKRKWNYACFGKTEGHAIGCAVLSRWELSDFTLNSLLVNTEEQNMPALRPILKVNVNVNQNSFVLLVNHWKSKSGGDIETEVWRDWQERQLLLLVQSLDVPCIVCAGDFNRDYSEFAYLTTKAICPWMSEAGTLVKPGSYYYKGEFERIDNFFIFGNCSICDFEPLTAGPWCNDSNIPIPFKLYSGSGYSDHLPVKCVISF